MRPEQVFGTRGEGPERVKAGKSLAVKVFALAIGATFLLASSPAQTQRRVQDELNRAKTHAFYRHSAALGNPKASEALVTSDLFSWPDEWPLAIYHGRLRRYMSAINGCLA